MADCVIKSNDSFEFTYSAIQQKEIERIRNKYLNIKKKEIKPMEKKNFITLVLGVVGGLFFALGMCMCLIPEWNMFKQGVVCAAIGIVVLIATVIAYRKMSGAAPIKLNWKVVGKVLYGTLSALVLGAGMALVLAVEGMMMVGIIVGMVGIVMLLFLIPMCVGLKDSKKDNQ